MSRPCPCTYAIRVSGHANQVDRYHDENTKLEDLTHPEDIAHFKKHEQMEEEEERQEEMERQSIVEANIPMKFRRDRS